MRIKQGTVTNASHEKTIVVETHMYRNHPKYKKRFRVSKKYHVDNPEKKAFAVGDAVTFYETRPISKLKKWTIIKPTNHDSTGK